MAGNARAEFVRQAQLEGYQPAEINDYLGKHPELSDTPPTGSPFQAPAGSPLTMTGQNVERADQPFLNKKLPPTPPRDPRDVVTGWLPGALATLLGAPALEAPPAAIALGMTGGLGGTALRDFLRTVMNTPEAPKTVGDAYRNTGWGGVEGALGTAAPIGLGKLIGRSGKGAMEMALPVNRQNVENFPGINPAEVALEHGLPVTRGQSTPGYFKVGDLIKESSAAERGLAQEAQAANPSNIDPTQTPSAVRWLIRKQGGVAYGPESFVGSKLAGVRPELGESSVPIAPEIQSALDKIGALSSKSKSAVAEARAYLSEWARDNADRVHPTDWLSAQKGLQDEARQAFGVENSRGGAAVVADSPVVTQMKQAIERAIRARMRSDIPGLGPQAANTRGLMALEGPMLGAELPPRAVSTALGSRNPNPLDYIPAANFLSRIGLRLSSPAIQPATNFLFNPALQSQFTGLSPSGPPPKP